MQFSNTKEDGLESIIVNWLVNQNDYEQGTNADYNRDYAIDETRLFRFLQDTQLEALEKLGVFKTDMKKKQFLNRLQGEIAKRGVIDVLRNGVKVYPANLIMFYLTPTENNAKARIISCLQQGFQRIHLLELTNQNKLAKQDQILQIDFLT